jgi:threonyl-tRNA synthetase
MPVLTFPDGRHQEFPDGVTGLDVAKSISPGLAKKALGIVLDDEVRDLSRVVERDAKIRIVTVSNEDPESLEMLRHSCAHVLAEAICELFPGTQLAYGPAIENGFFYDLRSPRPITDDDLPAIEKKMAEIVKANRPFVRCEYGPSEGLERTKGDKYKTDNAERALARGANVLSFYSTGEPGKAWEDLCSGPHVPSTKFLGAFKLTAVSGAYWHGDQASDQLTRVYGVCFADKNGLDEYLHFLEEAKRRDHRRIGIEMDLFHVHDDNPGQVFWHPNGWALYRQVEEYMRARLKDAGYVEVRTPVLQPRSLWERSGHWAKFKENMFVTHEGGDSVAPASAMAAAETPVKSPQQLAAEEAELARHTFALKPMNCPGHLEIFKTRLRSYRDLPLRMAEFGSCNRFEPSGALSGIMRVRGFTQDDAHIFCTEAQIEPEVVSFCDLLKQVYQDFGFPLEDLRVKFSTRPEVRVGSDEVWDHAEDALRRATDAAGLETELNPGEGAFYGPKLEFVLRDSLRRDWQCGTIQVDFNLPSKDRLNAVYVGEDGHRHHPVMLHRAILGSFERFLGILIEHYAGKFPLWLAPEQIRVLPITDDHAAWADEVRARLVAADLRVTTAKGSDKLGAKIREARNDRVPYFAVVGGDEVSQRSVSLQRQDGSKLGSYPLDALVDMLVDEVRERRVPGAEAATGEG